MFGRLLNIRQDEASKVVMLVILFFLFITGTAWAETIIESSFYYLAGVSRLSQVFTLQMDGQLIWYAFFICVNSFLKPKPSLSPSAKCLSGKRAELLPQISAQA